MWKTLTRSKEPSYLVEHLATFRIGPQFGVQWPEDGIKKLKQMERTSSVWAQKLILKLRPDLVILEDENGKIVEQFSLALITEPYAQSTPPNSSVDAYNNLLIFNVNEPDKRAINDFPAEMHIFQCVKISAKEVAAEIKKYLAGKPNDKTREPPQQFLPPEQLTPPIRNGYGNSNHETMTRERTGFNRRYNIEAGSHGFESDVNTLNCYFDDVERFVARVQSAIAANRELETIKRRRDPRRYYPGDGILHLRSQLPTESEFVDIFTKFKHCFNILGKLQHHIYDPNASELLHYLFSPLLVILDASHWALNKDTASQITYPTITREATLLLQRSLNQREYDIWNSLGDTWKYISESWNAGYPSLYRKGLYASKTLHHGYSTSDIDRIRPGEVEHEARSLLDKERYLREKEIELERMEKRLKEEQESLRDTFEKMSLDRDPQFSPPPPQTAPPSSRGTHRSQSSQRGGLLFSSERYSPAFHKQKAFYDDLKYQRAKIAFVTHDRVGQNSKELTVSKGEYLQVLNDTRNWWECRNANNRIGFVPNTILSRVYDDEPQRKLSLQQPITVAVPPQNVPLEPQQRSSRDNYTSNGGYNEQTIRRNGARY